MIYWDSNNSYPINDFVIEDSKPPLHRREPVPIDREGWG
jgi:hypothetical protein